MKRRTYLASVAAGIGTLAGCTATWAARPEPLHRVDIDDVRSEAPFDLDVAMVDDAITAGSTAQVVVLHTNVGDETVTVNRHPSQPDPWYSDGSPPGLLLLSDAYDPVPTDDHCWQPESSSFPQPARAIDYPLEPSETLRQRYGVCGAPRDEATCVQSGEYRFEGPYGGFTVVVR